MAKYIEVYTEESIIENEEHKICKKKCMSTNIKIRYYSKITSPKLTEEDNRVHSRKTTGSSHQKKKIKVLRPLQ